jgi:hypothetical protein
MQNLVQQIKGLEETLLQGHTRADQQMLSKLLHDDFEELGASGHVVTKSEAIDWLLREDDHIQWSLSDFKVRRLSDEIALATYRAQKTDLAANTTKHSLRSSLWLKTETGWALRFHQGTNLTKSR